MRMANKRTVFNVPAQYDFFKSFLHWLQKTFPDNLSEVKILLPNRRSCRVLSELFLREKCPIILPKIKTISDISYEDFLDFPSNPEVRKIVDRALQIRQLSSLDYLFFLSKEIAKEQLFYQKNGIDFCNSFNLAKRFKEVFEEIENEEIDLTELQVIDESALALHHQVNFNFIRKFFTQVKNSLLRSDLMPPLSYQNFAIESFGALLSQCGSKSPIIIAGSTGSLKKTRKFIKAVHGLDNSHVVLHGYRKEKTPVENHANFFLNQLVESLGIDEKNIRNITEEKFLLSDENRQDFLSLLMSPAIETSSWKDAPKIMNQKKIAEDFAQNFQLIEAKDKITEAKNIAFLLQKSDTRNKSIALISNDSELVDLVKMELRQLAISFNDARSLPIFDSKLVGFFLLITELIENDFNSYSLLALVKNPLCYHSKNQQIIQDFEHKILRQSRKKLGFSGLQQQVESCKDKALSTFFQNLCYETSPLNSLKSPISLKEFITALINAVELLSKKNLAELLEQEAAQEEIFSFIEKLKTEQYGNFRLTDLSRVLRTLFSEIRYFEKSPASSPIQILSTIEARLLNHDLIVISSLNEGIFPEIPSEDWLGKKIRKNLGIEQTSRKYGQNAQDFWNYLSNKSVVLTRALSDGKQPITPSPFLLKLTTLCKKLEITLSIAEEFLPNQTLDESFRIMAPEPKPENSLRPKKFSITEISKLIANPYTIYAKKILGLKELNEIDFESSYAEFGSFVHKALEEFVKDTQQQNFLQKSQEIFNTFFPEEEARMIWFPKFLKIFPAFKKENERFSSSLNYTEIPVKLSVGSNLISGKIDRLIIFDDGNAEIFDYKTGKSAAKNSVHEGIDPQLTISALALVEGMIGNQINNISEEKILGLNYWELSSSDKIKIKKIAEKNEEIKILLSAAKSGLLRLLDHFSNSENGYIATSDDSKTEFKHLIRAEEWN